MPRVNADPTPRPTDLTRNLTAALPVALVLVFVALLAIIVGSGYGPRFSASAMFTVLATVLLAAFLALTWRRRPRAGVLAACHALAWWPLVAIGATQQIGNDLVPLDYGRCATGLMAMIAFALPVGGIVLLLLGIAAGAIFARRGTNGAIRAAAFVTTTLAFVACAFALPRSARPDPDTYLASLVPVAEMAPESSMTFAGRAYRYERMGLPLEPHSAGAGAGAEAKPPEPLEPRYQCRLVGLDAVKTYSTSAAGCPTVRLRADRGHDVAVFESTFAEGYSGSSFAFRPSTGTSIAITPSTVADHIAPPIGWTAGAAIGGLLGLAFAFAAARVRRHAAAEAGIDARHLGDGVMELATGEKVRVDSAASMPLGDVVLGDSGEKQPTYRTMGRLTFGTARPGTLADLRMARTDRAASLDAIAVAAATLGALPLVMARLVAGL